MEDTVREAHERLQKINSQYGDQLKCLANGKEPHGDIHDLKEKADVLSDSVREREADCEVKQKELSALCDRLSFLQAQQAKKTCLVLRSDFCNFCSSIANGGL
jgi:seryl-tRNA synthetase